MATGAKLIFLQDVLHEVNLFERLASHIKIPKSCMKRSLLLMIPLAIAIFGGVKKSTIYGFDMFSDVKVKAHPDQEIVLTCSFHRLFLSRINP